MRSWSLIAALSLVACSNNARKPAEDVPVEVSPPRLPDQGPETPGPAASPALGPAGTSLRGVPSEISSGIELKEVARGLRRPVGLEHAAGDPLKRLFVVEQVGRISVLWPDKGFERSKTAFYDIRGKVSRGNEQGLLGLALHPKFIDNGKLYVNYTDRRGTTHVVEYRTTTDGTRVDMSSAREIFALKQPYGNHNGGYLEFGPDGKLYVGTGDGGAANDPRRAGQDKKQLLAKMLRFDVDKGSPKAEMIQWGLRNPWRFHFDSKTGDLYIADVGQNKWEEINVVAAGSIEGHNFGWNEAEGNHCFRRDDCDLSKYTAATIEYDHKTGCSITGGVVYRGKGLPRLDGVYFYADYCTALIRSFRWQSGKVYQHWDWKKALDPEFKLATISAFGTDHAGELYVLSLDGPIFRLEKK